MFLSQLTLITAALVAGQVQTTGKAPVDASPADVKELSKEQADAIISKCGTRRFETSADVPVDGKLRRTRVTLCAADSDTNADWLSKLEKAASQIEAQATLPEATRAKLLGDLRAEIARVKTGQSFALAPRPQVSRPPSPLASINALPPRPALRSPLADIPGLPPLPSAPAASTALPKAAVSLVRGPQLTVQCALVGVDRSGRCGQIASDERLVIRATEPFNGPVSLRFRRTGSSVSAEVPFASRGLRPGQTARFSIPKAICSGRIYTDFEIEVVTSNTKEGRIGELLGPFKARCEL